MLKRPRQSFVRLFLFSFVLSGIIFLLLLIPIVHKQEGKRYQLSSGTTLKNFSMSLHQQGIVKHPYLFMALVKLRGDMPKLKAGIYFFPKGTSTLSLLNQVTTGKGILYHPFTIIPGWTFNQLREMLLKNPH